MEGQYLKEDIPDFSRCIAVHCIGTVIYVDGQTVGIRYLEEEYKMESDQPGKREIWDKGKKFTFLVLFQLRVYNIQTIKVIMSVRYQIKEYSMSMENVIWDIKMHLFYGKKC